MALGGCEPVSISLGVVSSVSTTDPSLIVTPTTGAVIIYAFNPMFYSYYGGF